jgi:eukaryotic-like serine/threonine-protein kinase
LPWRSLTVPRSDWSKTLPTNSPRIPPSSSSFLPIIRAQLALNRRDPAGALKELDVAAPFDLANASPDQLFPFALYPCYLRGQAFLASDRAEQASVEFQQILNHSGIVINEPIGALAYKNLAHAYVALGQQEKAEAAYRMLMSLWRQADAINPVIRETSLDFRRLSGSDRRLIPSRTGH